MQQLLTGGYAAAAQPYTPYTGPRLAGLNQDQLSGMQRTRDVVSQTPGALSLAQPHITAASRTFPQAADEYMSPYTTHVTDRAAQLTNRALNEQLLPSLAAKFGSAGQDVRSSAYRAAADRGVRDLSEGLQAQNLAALEQGYRTSGEQFGADASRAGQLAALSGPLAQYAQQQGLEGADALGGIGATQQAQTQGSLDLAYQDFLRQQGYPQEQVDKMAGVLAQINSPKSQTTSAPIGGPGPSPLSQAGSLATGIGGLLELIKGNARGGRIQYNRGGPTRMLAYAA